MRAMQMPVTPIVARAIGMSDAAANRDTRTAARRAAAKLRELGYVRRQCHTPWERGMRWYAPGRDVPMSDDCATSVLGTVLSRGAT